MSLELFMKKIKTIDELDEILNKRFDLNISPLL